MTRGALSSFERDILDSAAIDGVFSRINYGEIPAHQYADSAHPLIHSVSGYHQHVPHQVLFHAHSGRDGRIGADFALAAASLVVGLFPLLVFYLIASERFVEGITAGALKG